MPPGQAEGKGWQGDVMVDVERTRVLLVHVNLQGGVLFVLREGRERGR